MTSRTQPATEIRSVFGSRIGAAIVDFIILLAMLFVFTLVFGESNTTTSDDGVVSTDSGLNGLAFIAYFVVTGGYFFVMEALKGQTLGKMLMGVKVVSGSGTPIGMGQAALRSFVRIIDFMPFGYLIGLVFVLGTKRKQRLGDLLADTLVVKA